VNVRSTQKFLVAHTYKLWLFAMQRSKVKIRSCSPTFGRAPRVHGRIFHPWFNLLSATSGHRKSFVNSESAEALLSNL